MLFVDGHEGGGMGLGEGGADDDGLVDPLDQRVGHSLLKKGSGFDVLGAARCKIQQEEGDGGLALHGADE